MGNLYEYKARHGCVQRYHDAMCNVLKYHSWWVEQCCTIYRAIPSVRERKRKKNTSYGLFTYWMPDESPKDQFL